MSSSEAVPAVAAADTERPLTNKEKRQLAVAQKRAAKEQAQASKTDSPAKRTAPDTGAAEGADGTQAEEGAEGEEEVEVLSHKEQRRRKKLAKQADGEGEAEVAGPNSLMHPTRAQGSSAAAQPRSGFSIWVGNLSFFTAPAKLVDWFEQRGVDGISRVNMPKGARRAEMNRGFCYLDLPSKDVLTAALNLSEQPLDGRKLLIKDGSDYTGRPDINTSALGIARNLPSATTSMHTAKDEEEKEEEREERQVKGKTGLTKTAQKILRAQKNAPSMTLFLGNLSFNTTEQGVRELFDASAQRRNPRTSKAKKQKKERKPKKASSSSGSDSSDSESESKSSSSSDSDSESESESETEPAAKEEEKEAVKSASSGDVVPSAAGIRKVRLGTFEDAPTKCKGFGFVDFHTLDQATASLIDPRNTFLDGRKLLLQYAGADATRRGASKTQKTRLDAPRENKKVGFMRKRPRDHDHSQQDQEQGQGRDEAPVPGSFDPDAPLPKKHKETKEERAARRAGPQRRAKPGAALANAPRASVGIVQSTGTKVTFD